MFQVCVFFGTTLVCQFFLGGKAELLFCLHEIWENSWFLLPSVTLEMGLMGHLGPSDCSQFLRRSWSKQREKKVIKVIWSFFPLPPRHWSDVYWRSQKDRQSNMLKHTWTDEPVTASPWGQRFMQYRLIQFDLPTCHRQMDLVGL